MKHTMRCQRLNKFVKDDNVTCKLCDQKFEHSGFLFVHLENQICLGRKEQICKHCDQEFTHNRQVSKVFLIRIYIFLESKQSDSPNQL